ncbi:MAG: LysM peptidoglycan-binding domain-containing protein [Anaerolineales bacterium]|nr:MAG: LysM peptidoglycan-binding domain-containing protein [Anaerolineales bacterium]
MLKKKSLNLLLVAILLLLLLPIMQPKEVQAQAGTAYDLIASVNALRASMGLTPLEVDPILMAAAQSHSEYQASLGYWTHEGPGGTRPRDRAAAAGYGGGATVFVSENVAVMNTSANFETLIYSIWSDALHWNTMTNPSYTHAGAGVAISGNEVYYTLDVGYIAGNPGGYVPGATYTPGSSGIAPTQPTSDFVSPVITATPHEDGSVYHLVEPGHALWSIAIAYNITIQDIIDQNNLDQANPAIWPGNELLIQPSLQPSLTFTPTDIVPTATRTPKPTYTPRPPTPTRTPTKVLSPTPEPFIKIPSMDNGNRRNLGIAVIAICSLGLLIVIFTGFRKPK